MQNFLQSCQYGVYSPRNINIHLRKKRDLMQKTNAIRLLENTDIAFRVLEYPVEDNLIDARSIAAKLHLPQEQVFKTLVAESPEHDHFVFVVPADGELDLKKAARAAGTKSIRMIPQKELLPLTGYIHGGCSPVGMKKQFPTFLEETAILFDTIYVSGGRIGCTLAIAPEELAGFLPAEFADLQKS